jgi:phosphoribosylanthranilate isomerase
MKSGAEQAFVVKICGITTQEDAAVSVEAGANAIGFNFYRRSPRYLEARLASAISDGVPGSYLRVGVFVNATDADIAAVAAEFPMDVVQLHGDTSRLSTPAGRRIWKSIAPGRVPPKDPLTEAYLIDTVTPGYGGSGATFDWSLAADFPVRAIIAGGLDATNVANAIRVAAPWGVDACSRLEFAPGRKDHSRVRAFIRAAQEAYEMIVEKSAL